MQNLPKRFVTWPKPRTFCQKSVSSSIWTFIALKISFYCPNSRKRYKNHILWTVISNKFLLIPLTLPAKVARLYSTSKCARSLSNFMQNNILNTRVNLKPSIEDFHIFSCQYCIYKHKNLILMTILFLTKVQKWIHHILIIVKFSH